MSRALKTVLAAGVIVVLVVVIIGTQMPRSTVEAPVRGTAPDGYGDYAVAVDPEFSMTVASELSAFGDDPALGFRTAGSPAEREAADLLAQTMRDIGLENVTIDKASSDGWTFNGASITYGTLGGETATAVLGGYPTDIVAENETLPIVYLGKGTAADYKTETGEDIDVTGKLVLIDIDTENDPGINYPAYQAHLKGARAVVACSFMDESSGERIVSGDIRGGADAPALAISAADSASIRDAITADGYEDGGAMQIDVTLNADSRVTRNVSTQNVWGEIPGESDQTIFFIAHYDGFYRSFYDDASGVGIVLGIAKAMREGGIAPEKTFRFVLHGASEWGRSDTPAGGATGAYEQIVHNRPGWAEDGFALFDIDGGYPLDPMRAVDILAPAEFSGFVSSSISSFGDRADALQIIPAQAGAPEAGRGDFIYNASGIPTIATGGDYGGDAEFSVYMLHSSIDRADVGGYDGEGVRSLSEYLGYAALMLDRLPLRPLRFTARIEELGRTLEGRSGTYRDADIDEDLNHLIANIERATEVARKLDRLISSFNAGYLSTATEAAEAAADGRENDAAEARAELDEMKSRAAEINKDLYAVYLGMQDGFLKLDRNLESEYANEGLQKNLDIIESAWEILLSGSGMVSGAREAAAEKLMEMEQVGSVAYFDAAVTDRFVQRLDDGARGTWAEGRIVSRAADAAGIVRLLLGQEEAAGAQATDAAAQDGAVTDGAATAGAASDAVTADGTQETEDEAQEQEYYSSDDDPAVKMLRVLIASQEDTLQAVYSGQANALAMLTDSMNAMLDNYGEEQEGEGNSLY
jgi:hypothetical protein